MSDHYYSVDAPGARIGDVTKATSTNATTVELRVTDGVAGNSKTEVLKALEAIRDFITTDDAVA